MKKELQNKNIVTLDLNLKNIPLRKIFDIRAAFVTFCLYKKIKPMINIANARRVIAIYLTLIQYKFIYKSNKYVFIKDQGIFQNVGTLRKYSKSTPKEIWTPWLIKNAYLPNILVVVTANREEKIKRRKKRDNSTFSGEYFIGGEKRLKLALKESRYISEIKNDFKCNFILNNDINSTYEEINKMISNIIDKKNAII
ncbi:MAG: hypothetical protein WD038_01515 [Balneolales bacterium]